MSWISIILWILGAIFILIIISLLIKKKSSQGSMKSYSYSSGGSFADKMKAVGRKVGDCCRKFGA